MTDDEICGVMRTAMKPFIVYRHVEMPENISWRTNAAECRADKEIEILDYADTVSEAVKIVSALKSQAPNL